MKFSVHGVSVLAGVMLLCGMFAGCATETVETAVPQWKPIGNRKARVVHCAPLATSVLLGNVAARAGKKKLLRNGKCITNDDAANAYLRTTYRKGWELS